MTWPLDLIGEVGGEQPVEHCRHIDIELQSRPAAQPTLLCRALSLLAGAALRRRGRFAHDDPPLALISCMSNGHLLAPPPPLIT